MSDSSEQRKHFCEEVWDFWPVGKYYYSMALMILQFVLPLFVLVITYTRIVIVVWVKRMPGEEDDARDARMARSKRKVNSLIDRNFYNCLLCNGVFNSIVSFHMLLFICGSKVSVCTSVSVCS